MSRQVSRSGIAVESPQVLRRPEVERLTGLSRSTIYAKMDPKSAYFDSDWPQKVRLGIRSVGWYRHEVIDWIESRAASDAQGGQS